MTWIPCAPIDLLQARLGMGVDVVGVQGTGLQEDGAGPVKTLPIPARDGVWGVTCSGSSLPSQTNQVLRAPLCCVTGFWPRSGHRAGGR